MKIKVVSRTSHSYGSRTHGPRKTTHGTSGEHPWWRGDSRRSILPPAGCREEVFWCSRSWKRGGGGTEERSRKRVSVMGVTHHDGYIGEGGHRGDPRGSQEGPWRGPGWGRTTCPLGCLVVALPSFLGDSGSFRDAEFLYNFSGIFGALLMAGKPEIQKQQKTGIGIEVH